MTSQPGRAAPAQLQFNDAQSCVRWLESVPLTHAPHAHELIATQLGLLNGSTLPALERLKILEALREPVLYIQGELAKSYLGKPVPLSIVEFSVWTGVTELWQIMHRGYRQCLHAYRAGERDIAPLGALVCLRALQYTNLGMLERFRIYRDAGEELWRQLHEIYAFAEARGFAGLPADEGVRGAQPSSTCTAVYAHALLAALGNPYALTSRQMEIMFRWLDQWRDTVGLAREPLPADAGPALAVDLRGSAGAVASREIAPGADARYLNLEQLSKTLRRLLGLLRQGQSPGQLGLGRDLGQPGCEKLLTLLYIQWCGAGTGRINERTQAARSVLVCGGMHATHFHVGGKPFRQPGASRTREEESDLHLFGHVTERTLRSLVSQPSAASESWQLVNQNAAGFLGLVRPADLDTRIAHLQLVAIKREAGSGFQAGVVQWMKAEDNGELFVGVRLLPGAPRAVAIRGTGAAVAPGRFERAVLLPEAPELQAPASLVMAPGTFQPGRFFDLYTDRASVVKVNRLIERGADFERADIIVPR
ncbi:MAG TPA: hypothetical protein VMK05_04350 [Burkholderiales bacterium]|nr:hypothetical protein [Burkholderiales bacterium]